MSNRYVIATSRLWVPDMVETLTDRLGVEFVHITEKEQLNKEALEKTGPRYMFFPHWSHIIPKEIHGNFECVVFHMTDVPFGRGGSPLQNLIERGIYQTMLTALKVEDGLDTGDVYMKRPLSLYGSAEEIYIRASHLIMEMIGTIITQEPSCVPQTGDIVEFQRRTPRDSDISTVDSLEQLFSNIRMLDAEGYPHAFLETAGLRFEFTRASMKKDCIIADVKITGRK